jgi:hypothetical protein
VKKKLHIRRFLNKEEGIASIEVRGELPDKKYDKGWVYLGIAISDYDKVVHLDFDYPLNKGSRKLSFEKLDNLIADFIVARDWLKEACEGVDGR